jgi:hypothetical protein
VIGHRDKNEKSMPSPLVIFTGASGAGKTTLARHFFENESHRCQVFFFDSISVPSTEKMATEYGSGEAWQQAMTLQWMARLRPMASPQRPVLLEGQMRIAFIREGLAASEIATARIILIDCDDNARIKRLRAVRSQPELANPTMLSWARYLREEASRFGVDVLDTTERSVSDCAADLKFRLFEANEIQLTVTNK